MRRNDRIVFRPGHDVVILYFTRGEVGIEGKSMKESAEIRTAESRKACEILKARPVFAGQIDGSTEVEGARCKEFRHLWKRNVQILC
jgi:N-acetylglucosamine malate deacetylase 1